MIITMKRFIVSLIVAVSAFSAFAQKYAYVDTDYILSNIPAYKESQEQLDKLSIQWQKEIDEKYAEVDRLYKQFQVDKYLLTDDMKSQRELEIAQKEKEVKQLQKKRFGTDGDRFKKEQELIKPIQDEVYNALKDIAAADGYAVIFDSASSSLSMLYTDPKYDVSDEVLKKLGYVK